MIRNRSKLDWSKNMKLALFIQATPAIISHVIGNRPQHDSELSAILENVGIESHCLRLFNRMKE